jgi:hypothetical protein
MSPSLLPHAELTSRRPPWKAHDCDSQGAFELRLSSPERFPSQTRASLSGKVELPGRGNCGTGHLFTGTSSIVLDTVNHLFDQRSSRSLTRNVSEMMSIIRIVRSSDRTTREISISSQHHVSVEAFSPSRLRGWVIVHSRHNYERSERWTSG